MHKCPQPTKPGILLGFFSPKWRAIKRSAIRPTTALVLLLALIPGGFAFMFAVNHGYIDYYFDVSKLKSPSLHTPEWIAAFGVMLAATGWVISSLITMRNSKKQHTINTLLQTRLSMVYMEHHKQISKSFAAANFSGKSLPLDILKADAECRRSVDYLLNFQEFLAVGIRHGDLDENVLRDSMRGIVVDFTALVWEYIVDLRLNSPGGFEKSRSYEHLLWLRARWNDI